MGRPSKMAEVTGLLCGPAGQQGQVHARAKPAASPGAWFGAGEAVGTRLIHCPPGPPSSVGVRAQAQAPQGCPPPKETPPRGVGAEEGQRAVMCEALLSRVWGQPGVSVPPPPFDPHSLTARLPFCPQRCPGHRVVHPGPVCVLILLPRSSLIFQEPPKAEPYQRRVGVTWLQGRVKAEHLPGPGAAPAPAPSSCPELLPRLWPGLLPPSSPRSRAAGPEAAPAPPALQADPLGSGGPAGGAPPARAAASTLTCSRASPTPCGRVSPGPASPGVRAQDSPGPGGRGTRGDLSDFT